MRLTPRSKEVLIALLSFPAGVNANQIHAAIKGDRDRAPKQLASLGLLGGLSLGTTYGAIEGLTKAGYLRVEDRVVDGRTLAYYFLTPKAKGLLERLLDEDRRRTTEAARALRRSLHRPA